MQANHSSWELQSHPGNGTGGKAKPSPPLQHQPEGNLDRPEPQSSSARCTNLPLGFHSAGEFQKALKGGSSKDCEMNSSSHKEVLCTASSFEMLCNQPDPPSPCSLFKSRSFFREWTRSEWQGFPDPWLEIPSFPTALLKIRRNLLLQEHIPSSDGQGQAVLTHWPVPLGHTPGQLPRVPTTQGTVPPLTEIHLDKTALLDLAQEKASPVCSQEGTTWTSWKMLLDPTCLSQWAVWVSNRYQEHSDRGFGHHK